MKRRSGRGLPRRRPTPWPGSRSGSPPPGGARSSARCWNAAAPGSCAPRRSGSCRSPRTPSCWPRPGAAWPGPIDDVVVTTGVGFRGWMAAAEGWGLSADLADAPDRRPAAHPRPQGAGRRPRRRAERPLDARHRVAARRSSSTCSPRTCAGRRIAVQLHGEPLTGFVAALREAGAEVIEVPVYRWLPYRDPSPLRRLISQAISGGVDAVAFTSAPAVLRHAQRGPRRRPGGRAARGVRAGRSSRPASDRSPPRPLEARGRAHACSPTAPASARWPARSPGTCPSTASPGWSRAATSWRSAGTRSSSTASSGRCRPPRWRCSSAWPTSPATWWPAPNCATVLPGGPSRDSAEHAVEMADHPAAPRPRPVRHRRDGRQARLPPGLRPRRRPCDATPASWPGTGRAQRARGGDTRQAARTRQSGGRVRGPASSRRSWRSARRCWPTCCPVCPVRWSWSRCCWRAATTSTSTCRPSSPATRPDALVAAPLGPHPLLTAVLARRLAGAGLSAADSVILGAAGSSDPAALADVRAAARLLSVRLSRPVTAAFASTGTPSVGEALERLRSGPLAADRHGVVPAGPRVLPGPPGAASGADLVAWRPRVGPVDADLAGAAAVRHYRSRAPGPAGGSSLSSRTISSAPSSREGTKSTPTNIS